jgi:chemotaxis protein MotB
MPVEDKPVPRERKRVNPDQEGGGLSSSWPPVWMTTYSDMITNLMTFFVLLYALTMVRIPFDLVKFAEPGDKRIVPTGSEDFFYTDETQSADDIQVLEQIERMTAEDRLALSEMATFQEQVEELKRTLEKGRLADGVKVLITAEDVVIVPSAPLIFAEGSDRIKESFFPILDRLAGLIKDTKASVRIEGHTDDTPIDPLHRNRFPSNYELSAARAIAVGRYFIEKHAVPPERIAVAGYGPLLPRFLASEPEKRALNRRVEFHIFISSATLSKEG